MGSRLDATSSAVRKRIQSHSFENEHGEEYEASAFGGFGDYMRRKKAKLQNLDSEIRSSAVEANCPQIFQSVVAHVNGYTQPSLQDLHKLIVRHGGGFLQYLDSKTAATHIIASSLTPKKRDEFRRYRVVKPAWVVESVKAGQMLPWDAFRLVDEGQAQKVLKFDNGSMVSQANSPQTSYRDESRSSWYWSRLRVEETRAEEFSAPRETFRSPDKPVNPGSQSDYGDFPSFTSLDDAIREPQYRKPGGNTPQSTASDIHNTTLRTTRSPSPEDQTTVADAVLSPQSETIPSKSEMTSEDYNAQLLSDPRTRNSSVANSEFIQQYYRESRLHHLSTWKAELKAQLQSKAQEKSQSRPLRNKLIPGSRRYIMHVDFDCFFAAVSTLNHPELEGKPVAIAHGTGTGSEIASCNYTARASGVKNGMWMKSALQACPDLKVLPYDFPAYEDASRKFYRAILSVDGFVQSVSIDEALVDITSLCLEAGGTDGRGISEGSIYREQAKADEIAEKLRAAVKSETGCAVSVGIGGNILQAKVALRKAKPAGQFQLTPEAVLDFIGDLPVQSLPGVGFSLSAKLEELGIKLVKDIRELSREKLVSSLGPKTGAKLWDYTRGIDRTEVGNEVVRKSVSAEVNWGIRFVTQAQAEDFMQSLCEELHRRLVENLVRGKQLTLKVMRRSPDAPLEPVKHLGHGQCDVLNKSVALGVATNSTDVLAKEAISMLRSLGISPGDLRGLGVQMTKLEPLTSSGNRPDGSQQQLTFKSSPSRKGVQPPNDPDLLDSPRKGDTESIRHRPVLNDNNHKPLNILGTQFILPSQPDPTVIAELPSDIRSKLISQGKPRSDTRSGSPTPVSRPQSISTALPPQSKLDPGTLAALPDDVLAEIMGYYNQPSETNRPPAVAPSNPPTSRPPTPAGTLMMKKPTSPPKKRRGRPSSKNNGNNASLTQSKFVFSRSDTPSTIRNVQPPSRQSSPSEEPSVSAEFLAALPEDIRREVLEEQKRTRLLQRSANIRSTSTTTTTTITTLATAHQAGSSAPPPPPQEKQLRLPPLPERPTFTSKKLSSLPDLRDAVSAWHAAFTVEGPFEEDVASLAEYLRRVVLEEKDVDKAVSLVKWLMWLADNDESAPSGPSRTGTDSQGTLSWEDALESLRQSIQLGLEERNLPPVDFS